MGPQTDVSAISMCFSHEQRMDDLHISDSARTDDPETSCFCLLLTFSCIFALSALAVPEELDCLVGLLPPT